VGLSEQLIYQVQTLKAPLPSGAFLILNALKTVHFKDVFFIREKYSIIGEFNEYSVKDEHS
jgi:hypothetical protein